jgi:hypothetical protein
MEGFAMKTFVTLALLAWAPHQLEAGILRPELGVYLEDLGDFNPSTEEMYATVVIPIPRLPMEVYNITELNCKEMLPDKQMQYTYRMPPWVNRARTVKERKALKNHNTDMLLRQTAGISICDDYNRSIRGLSRILRRHYDKVNQQQDNLLKILQAGDAMVRNEPKKPTKQKRALPLIFGVPILSAAKAIGSIVMKAIEYRRISNLKKVISKIGNEQQEMKWFMRDEANKAATFQKNMKDQLTTIKEDIKYEKIETDKMIMNLTTELYLLQERMSSVNSTIVHLTNAASKLSSHVTTLIRNNLFALSSYDQALSDWTSGAMQLSRGRLSEAILSPTNFEHIITNISNNIENLGGHLDLLEKGPLDYYHHARILYTTVKDHIVVQIPMPLKPKYGEKFTLFKLQSVYMPLDTTWFGNKHKEFTRLLSDRQYIAIGQQSYIELTQDQFEECRSWSQGISCEGKQIFISHTRKSCLKLLHAGYKINDLMKHCSLMYYRGYQASPGLIETDNYLLITGFGRQWTHTCQGRKQNSIINAKNFILIPKQKFGCTCTLQNEKLYIEGSGSDCITQIHPSDLLFPVNAIQYAIFESVVPANKSSGSTLYHTDAMPSYILPQLRIEHTDNDGVLAQDGQLAGIPIAKLQKLVSAKREIYLTRSDLITAESMFQNWFRGLKTGKIVTFVLALVGTVTGLVTIYLLFKYTNLAAIVTSLQLIRGAKGESTGGTQYIAQTIMSMCLTAMLQAALIFLGLLILKAIWKMARQTQVHRRFLHRKNKPKMGASRSDIYIEISDGESAHTQYLASVGVHGSLIHDLPQENCDYPEVIAHEKYWINDILTISWKQLDTITLTDLDVLHLPAKLIVAWADKSKIRKILSHAYTMRVIIESGGLLWQISHNLIQSRTQRWCENYSQPLPTRMIVKERAEMPLLMREDRMDRDTLRRQWTNDKQAEITTEIQLKDEEETDQKQTRYKSMY